MTPLGDIAVVAGGGAVGAVGRYLITALPLVADHKYWLTFIINVTGSALIGVVWTLLQHYQASTLWALLLITGLLGGYTTYSAFSLETVRLLLSPQWLQGLVYALATLIAAVGACAGALALTQHLLP